MRIIFVKDHIVHDVLGILVKVGRKGTLIDEANGKIELDEIVVMNETESIRDRGEIIYGTIEGVQPSFYISLRKDL